MEIHSEFIDTSNVLKHNLSKMWFDLKEINANSESDPLDFKRFQKENIAFNANTSMHHVVKMVYFLMNIKI